MSESRTIEIAARTARGFQLDAGSSIRVINSMGAQVVAVWAFLPEDVTEFMSMEHTRIHAKSSRPRVGTVFYTNCHRPILEMTADSSPGVHDWFLAACNQQRYEMLGHQGHHASCAENLHLALREFDLEIPYVPCPLNLFENVPVLFGDRMEIKPPVTMPGDSVSFRAKEKCLIILSACPQDILLTNGPDHLPRGFEVEILSPL